MHWRSITPTIGVVITLALTSCSSSTASSTPLTTSTPAATTTAAGATPPPSGAATTTAPTTAAPTTAAATAAPTTAAPTTAAPTTVPAPPAVATASTCPDGAPTTLTCLTVAVPVDPTAPTGKSINLAVTVRRASPTTWTAPVLSILGTTPTYPWTDPAQPTVFPGHDMIWVDQRGAGRSDGVTDCPDLQTYAAEIATAHLGTPAVAAIKACLSNAAQSVVPFTSIFDHRIVAADIGIVRRALGISTWALYAGSAGADTALQLVDHDPASVSAIVSRTPTAVGAGLNPNNLAAGFARFAADCAAATKCKANGDLQQALAKTYARFATPVTTKVTEKVTGVPIVFDQRLLLDSMQTIRDLKFAPLVPGRLAGSVSGATDTVVATAYAEVQVDPWAWTLPAHCQSADYLWPGLVTTSDDQAGIFKAFTNKPFCDAVGPLPQFSPRANPTSSVPVLAVLPSYDIRSSVTTTKLIFGGFANTTIVEVPRIADPLQQLTDCFYATANAFLAAPGEKLDTSCLTSPAISTLA